MITLDAIELPVDLVWMDEFDWTPAKQQETYTLTGALVIERGFKQAGRPITLGESTMPTWTTRQTVLALYSKLNATLPMVLTLNDGQIFNVVFNHNQNPIQVKPVLEYTEYSMTDYYSVEALRFLSL